MTFGPVTPEIARVATAPFWTRQQKSAYLTEYLSNYLKGDNMQRKWHVPSRAGAVVDEVIDVEGVTYVDVVVVVTDSACKNNIL